MKNNRKYKSKHLLSINSLLFRKYLWLSLCTPHNSRNGKQYSAHTTRRKKIRVFLSKQQLYVQRESEKKKF